MVLQTVETSPHWAYFIAIERDLTELSRYVEFDDRNSKCFSIEIAKVLFSASAEAEIVCKRLCQSLNRDSSVRDMRGYRNEITDAYPELPDFKVLIPMAGLTLTPWTEWKNKDCAPIWWDGYNNVKHHRHTHYDHANLKNALNAVPGLFLVVLHLYREKAWRGELTPRAQLLTTEHAGMSPDGGSYWIPSPVPVKIG